MPKISQKPDINTYKLTIRKSGIVYIEQGLVLIALRPWDKRPLVEGWADDSSKQIRTVEELDAYLAKGVIGLGLHCGASGIIAVDFDTRYKPKHDKTGREQFDRWLLANEQIRYRLMTDFTGDNATSKAVVHATTEDDYTITVDGQTKTVCARHHLFRNVDNLPNTTNTPPQIDTRGNGGYIVLPATVVRRTPDEGGTWHNYTVTTQNPNYAMLPNYPQWLADMTHPKKATKPTTSSPDTTSRQIQALALGLAKMTDVTPQSETTLNDPEIAYNKAIAKAGSEGRNDTGLWLACQLRDGGLSETDAHPFMKRYQEAVDVAGDAYTIKEAEASLSQAYKRPKREPAQYQGQRRINNTTNNNAVIVDGQDPVIPTLEPTYDKKLFGKLPLTDSGNADRFIASTRGNVAYNESMKKWLVWSGQQWKMTDDNRIGSFGRRVAEYITVEADSVTSSYPADTKEGLANIKVWQRHAIASQSKQRIDAMISLSRGDVATVATDYDKYLDYLPCSNGVVDLRNGTLLQHSRNMRYTKITDIEYIDDATCPNWLQFLNTVTGGDNDLINYLQMQVGYSLTGRTDQQVLLFLYGNGANGKSTFINTIAKLAGEYHTKISMDGIIDTENKGGPSPQLVALQGMRFTEGSEFPAGKRINEAMVKDLTGGDSITARPLYGDPFTFKPSNKFWLTGNHKPRITGTDNGIWRRLILIPFNHTIPETQRRSATEIEAIFDNELPGILAWAVRGAVAWYAHEHRASLPKPAVVISATDEYRQEEDTLARFMAEQCDVVTMLSCTTKELWDSFHGWLEEQGERTNTWNQTRLTRELKSKSIVQSNDRRKYLGIRPRPQGNVND